MRPLSDTEEFGIIVTVIFFSFGILYFLIDPDVFLITATVGLSAAVIGLLPVIATDTYPITRRVIFFVFLLVIVIPLVYGALRLEWELLSPISLMLLSALALVFFYHALFLPLAFLNLRWRESDPEPTEPYPTVSVIIPAYNEEKCIGASIQSLKRTSYPEAKKEIVVVDDGSTDNTYEEAKRYADETVTILQKSNGGKYTALNHGFEYCSGEIVVTVDADSLLEADTLRSIVGSFQQDGSIGAIAGNLTVANQGSIITKLQEVEYVVGIQLFRRAYDAVNAVIVVPGAFGAYRREALERVGGFDGDTLTEDRDATVKILKSGSITRASEALCHTEAPETWRDLYKQRLRWYRGTVQTLLKHRDVFTSPRYGHLYSLAFPMEAFNTVGTPLIGIAVIVSIIVELITGSVMQVVSLFLFFSLLQTLVSVLALRLGNNDPKLALYAPLFILGYRQFLDGVMVKSIKDVLLNHDLQWTNPTRTGQLHQILKDTENNESEQIATPELSDRTD